MRGSSTSAFTLIEVLAAIAIIGTLLCLLLPAINAIRRSADRAHAHSDVLALVAGIKNYRDTYSKWPNQSGTNETTYEGLRQTNILNALTNVSDRIVGGRGNRQRRKEGFIKVPPSSLTNNCFMDPWRRPYVIAMDENGDDFVAMNATSFVPNVTCTVKVRVAVFSWGRDPSNANDRVYSWTF